jgi:hypothetical protein
LQKGLVDGNKTTAEIFCYLFRHFRDGGVVLLRHDVVLGDVEAQVEEAQLFLVADGAVNGKPF